MPLKEGREVKGEADVCIFKETTDKRGWSLNREALALNVQRVTHVSSTSSGVTHRSGGLADWEFWLEEPVWDRERLVSAH